MWVIMCVSWLYLCFIDYLINFHYYPASPRYSSAKVKITSWHTIQENCSSENIFLILERKEKMTNIRGEVETLSAWRVVWDEEYICSNSDNKWLEIWSNSFVQKDTAGQKKIRIPFDSSSQHTDRSFIGLASDILSTFLGKYRSGSLFAFQGSSHQVGLKATLWES